VSGWVLATVSRTWVNVRARDSPAHVGAHQLVVVEADGVDPRCVVHARDPCVDIRRGSGYVSVEAGLDAGALCGLPPTTGVLATTDKDAIVELGADVVIHAASKAHAIETNAADICRLLAAPWPTTFRSS
jgi:hypothetical protein